MAENTKMANIQWHQETIWHDIPPIQCDQILSRTSKLSPDMPGIPVLDLEQLENLDLKEPRLSDFQG